MHCPAPAHFSAMDGLVITPLMPHQRDLTERMIAHEARTSAADDTPLGMPSSGALTGGVIRQGTGTGKTLVGITTALRLASQFGAPALIIAPATLMSEWSAQVARHCSDATRLTIFHGHRRNQRLAAPADIVLTTFETAAIAVRNPDRFALMRQTFSALVIDEVHRLCNNADMRASIISLARATGVRVTWCMTATPMPNGHTGLRAYAEIMRVSPYNLPGWFSSAPDRAVTDWIAEYFLVASDASHRLAPLERRTVELVGTEAEVSIDALGINDTSDRSTIVRIGKAYQMLNHEILPHVRGLRKRFGYSSLLAIQYLISLAPERTEEVPVGMRPEARGMWYDSTKTEAIRRELLAILRADAEAKVLIVTKFAQMVDLLDYMLSMTTLPTGVYARTITGDRTKTDRDHGLTEFARDPLCRILVGTTGAIGIGVSIPATTHTFIVEPQWSKAHEDQIEGRARRIGGGVTRPRIVVRFVVKNAAIEERIRELQRVKEAEEAEVTLSGTRRARGTIIRLYDGGAAAGSGGEEEEEEEVIPMRPRKRPPTTQQYREIADRIKGTALEGFL